MGENGNNGNEVTDEGSTTKLTLTPSSAETWVVPSLERDLNETAQDLREGINESEEYTDFLEQYQDKVVVFFAIAREILSQQTRELFSKEIVAENYRDGTVTEYVGNNIFDTFRHFDIMDEELDDKIHRTMKFRGDLVHDPKQRHLIDDLSELDDRINDALSAIEEMDNMLDSAD